MTKARATATTKSGPAPRRSESLSPAPSMIVVGKDVLELLSSAMYVEPLSIYREYVQNAADAIDEARTAGLFSAAVAGRVDIRIDTERRSIAIRDNGAGIPVAQAAHRLLAIGASTKRGTRARGFRGVGRLAGLAYGRSLTFRTRSVGDDEVIELRWDCQRLKAALREVGERDDIASVIQRVVSIRRLAGRGWPKHFFEVELADVIRTKRDSLLSEEAVSDYLAQVAPVPFACDFSWAEPIGAHLEPVRMANLAIHIGDRSPLTRPFADIFKVSDTLEDRYSEIELMTLTDLDGGIAALGWILHHHYLGSITVRSHIGGLRARVGNVQIGSEALLEDFFPEVRFNGWAVGELHVLDPRILPNARRDNFEQNVHYSNLTAQLEPVARQIARRARTASIARNQLRREELAAGSVAPHLEPSPVMTAVGDQPSGENLTSAPAPVNAEANRLGLAQKRVAKAVRAVLERSALSRADVQAVLRTLLREVER